MKKLLTILGAVGLTASTGAVVVSCGNPDQKPVSKLSLDEANERFGKLHEDYSKLLEEWLDTNTSEERKEEIKPKMDELSFKMIDFIAQILLETNFSVNFDTEKPTIKEKENDEEYNESLKRCISGLKTSISDFEENHKDWTDILKDYLAKIEEKLEKNKD